MKHIKNFAARFAMAAAVLGGLSLTGCNDLTETTYTFIDPNAFYKTEAEVNQALNGAYNRFRQIYRSNSQLYLANIELLTEQAWPTYNKNNMELINKWSDANNESASNGVHKVWGVAYECVNRANIVLGRVGSVSDMPQESADRINGQAYFLRAYSFFHLLRLFGGVPLPTTYTNGIEGLETPRKTVAETYDRIIEDLKLAESLLPERGASGYDVWRASKGSAQALLGEVYLYRASMSDVNGEQARKNEFLTAARDYSYAVIASGVYSLMPNFTDQFYWFNEAGAKNNQESIFELQFANSPSQSNDMHIRFGLGRTYSNYMGCYQYARMGVSGFLYQEMVNNGDRRAEAFLTYFEENDGTAHTFDAATLHWNPVITNDRNAEHRAVFNCKYFDQHTDFSLQRPNANFPMLRYAEVLLNYAEAANLLGAPATGGPTAVACVNEVRNRAGLADYSGSDLDEEIFQQRRFEFVGEGKIFFDELRRGVLADYSSQKCIRGITEGITYFDAEVLFKPAKNFLFKIPKGDLDSNPALEQNPDNVSL